MQWAVQTVAATVTWLHTCQRPIGTDLGAVGGGLIQHDFFADREAPIEFTDVQMLQRYINIALKRLPPSGRCTVHIIDEPILLCHSDITLTNFLVDADGLVMLDAQHPSFVPSSLASYALHANPDKFVQRVSKLITLAPSLQLRALAQAAGLIRQTSHKSLGLASTGHSAQEDMAKAAWGGWTSAASNIGPNLTLTPNSAWATNSAWASTPSGW